MSMEIDQFGQPESVRYQDAVRRGEATQCLLAKLRVKRAATEIAETGDREAEARRVRMDELVASRRASVVPEHDRLARIREQQDKTPKSVPIEHISMYVTQWGWQCEIKYDFRVSACVAKLWPLAKPDKVTMLTAPTMADTFEKIKAHIESTQDSGVSRSTKGNRRKKRKR